MIQLNPLTQPMADAAGHIELRNGRLHIPAAVCAQCMPGCTAVALLLRDGQWWLLPLLHGAGGLQLKLRNPQGDRVVEAQEFFRAQGVGDDPLPRAFQLQADAQRGAYLLQSVLR